MFVAEAKGFSPRFFQKDLEIMSDITIRCRKNGPFLVEGKVTLVDHEGNAFTLNPDKPSVALCRCGVSANRPFCDGAHGRAGFESGEAAK